MTVRAAVPRPITPVLRSSSKSSGTSSSSAERIPMLIPPGTTALTLRPFQTPPASSSMSWRLVVPRGAGLGDRPLHHPEGVDVLEPDVDVGRRGAGGEAGDQDPLQEHVGVLLHDDPVVERRRLALVAVDAEQGLLAVLGQEGPLQ